MNKILNIIHEAEKNGQMSHLVINMYKIQKVANLSMGQRERERICNSIQFNQNNGTHSPF